MEKKLAVVTGAGTGIGQGVAIELAGAGYDVAVHYFGSREGALETVAECRKRGARAEAFQADLSQKEQIDAFFGEAVAFLGGLTLFVNNSGVTKATPFEEITEELFDYLVRVDMKSALFCVQAAARCMIDAKAGGNIVVIASNNAMMQRYGVTVYGMVKASLVKMVRHAAVELARFGIRVNAVAPGWTATQRVLGSVDYERTVRPIPMRRMTQPGEIGQIVLFYTSPAAASITGNCIVADGGFTLINDDPAVYGY